MMWKILQYGNFIATDFYKKPQDIQKELEPYSQLWKPYNPRKHGGREGLSITSLDGGFSGVPDLDSTREYEEKNNTILSEMMFNKKTQAANIMETYMKPFEGHIGRSHFIKMDNGGHFPPHRDQMLPEVDTMRLFIPIKKCNPPDTWFMLEREPLYFDHGRAYFINTCIEHTLFSCYPSLFAVFNIKINDETIKTLLANMQRKV